jgi:AraC-like DNA-binding protein
MDAPDPSRRHLMLITPERVFYAGLLGRPKNRLSNAFNVYVALEGGLSMVADRSREDDADLIAATPNLRHTISSDGRSVVCVVIEPETVAPGGLERLAARLAGPERLHIARRVRTAHAALSRRDPQDLDAAELDRLCFGEPLPARALDPRVVRGIARITAFDREPATAAACAGAANLSVSRFLHLFREETGVSFRAFRAWKRARHLLHYVSEDVNLARLAQDIGYPDSSHFSHSVRRFYGLKPRAIFSGSRDLAVYSGPGAAPLRVGAKMAAGAT